MENVNTYEHHRVIFPVGQGGFAFENIGDSSLIYDCGSDTAPTRVCHYVDLLLAHGINEINYLVVSHFDNDHVNCIDYLLSKVRVQCVLAPYIPDDLLIVYNAVTHNAVSRLRDICQRRDTEYIEIDEERSQDLGAHNIWEWHIKTMLTNADFGLLQTKLASFGINTQNLNDPDYVTQVRQDLNKAFASLGHGGPNAKGLIMLSQKAANAHLESTDLTRGCHHCFPCHVLGIEYNLPLEDTELTSCLYVGDADLKSRNKTAVQDFFQSKRHEDSLLLMQIPHHGSRYNSDANLPPAFPAKYYFVCDKDDTRFNKNDIAKIGLPNVLMVRDVCCDLIYGVTHVY